MCASCDAWVRARHDPNWRVKTFGKVKTMGQDLPWRFESGKAWGLKPRTS